MKQIKISIYEKNLYLLITKTNTYESRIVKVRSFLLGTILINSSLHVSNLDGSVRDS